MNPNELFAFLAVFGAVAFIAKTVAAAVNAYQSRQLELRKLELQSGAGLTEVAALRTEVQDLRGQLTEVQERLDFTERLLAQGRDRNLLARGT